MLGELIAGAPFQEALHLARGEAPLLLVSGDGTTIGGGDARISGILTKCLRSIDEAAGMDVSHASFFVSKERTTTVVRLDLAVIDSDVAVYHDTLTGAVEYQILHRSTIQIAFGSHTLAMIVSGTAPDRILDMVYGTRIADDVRTVLGRLGLRMKPTDNDEMEYESYAFGLEAEGPSSEGNGGNEGSG